MGQFFDCLIMRLMRRRAFCLLMLLALTPSAALSGDAESRVNQYIIEIHKKQEIERAKAQVEGLRLPQNTGTPQPLSSFGAKANSNGIIKPEEVNPLHVDPVVQDPSVRLPATHLNEMVESQVEGRRGTASQEYRSEREIIEVVKQNARANGYEVIFDPQQPTRVLKIIKRPK